MKRNYRNTEVVDFQGRSKNQVRNNEEIGCLSVVVMAILLVGLFVVGIIIR